LLGAQLLRLQALIIIKAPLQRLQAPYYQLRHYLQQ